MRRFFTQRYFFLWIYSATILLGAIGYLSINYFQLTAPVYKGILYFLIIIPATGISITKLVESTIKFNFDKLLEDHKESIKAQYSKREQAKQIAKFLALVRKYVFLLKLIEKKEAAEQTTLEVDNINSIVAELNTRLWGLYLILPTDICLKLNKAINDIGNNAEVTSNDIIIEIKSHLNATVQEDNKFLTKNDILGVHYYKMKRSK